MLDPQFHTYPDKPTRLITGSYSTVRGAELRAITEIIERQGDNVPKKAFVERFARRQDGELNTDHVNDCLDFFQSIDYLELDPQDLISKYNRDFFSDLSFEARLLAHIRHQGGRSRHITYISEVASRFDQRRVTADRLNEEVQADDAESFEDELSWTVEKIRFWANLHDTLGAVSYTSGSESVEIVTSPTRALLHELIAYYDTMTDGDPTAAECLRWIDEWFFPIFSDRAGVPRVAVGTADTLTSMEDDGAISVLRESDSQSVVEFSKDSEGSRTISKLVVDEKPNSVAYEYPLSRTTGRFKK